MEQNELFPETIGESDKTDEVKQPADEAVSVNSNTEKLKQLENDLKSEREERKRLNDQMLSLMSSKETQPAPVAVIEEEPPDPIEDPKAYAKWLNTQTQNSVSQQTDKLKKELETQKKYDGLWSDFKTDYPDIAEKYRGLVEYIASKKVREIASSGVNVESYIFSDKKKFMKEVVNDIKSMVDIKEESEGSSQEGLPSTKKTTSKRPPKEEEPAPMSFMQALNEHRKNLYPLNPIPSGK